MKRESTEKDTGKRSVEKMKELFPLPPGMNITISKEIWREYWRGRGRELEREGEFEREEEMKERSGGR